MKNYSKLFNFYTSEFIKYLRLFLFIIFIFCCIYLFLNFPDFLGIPLFLLGLLVIVEIFFRFHVYQKGPTAVLENTGDIFESFTLNALRDVNENGIIFEKIFKEKPVKFILRKIDTSEQEIKRINIKSEELTKYTFELVKNIKGEFITAFDIFIAYLLITEDQTKLLFSKEIKKEQLMDILLWTRETFPKFEKADEIRVNFWGEGIAEEWVTGWTIETKKYTIDRTWEILNNKLKTYDQEEEYRKLVEALASNKSSLVVGEPGVGKDTLIRKFAKDSFTGVLKGNLRNQRLLQLLSDAFLAGSQTQGEMEERFENIIAELAHSGNIIVYIDDFENILGNSSFKLDLSGALIPYLKRGIIRIIATTTPGSFKKFIEPLHEFLAAFEVIKMEEPDKSLILPILFEKANQLERTKNVSLDYRTLCAAIEFGSKYSRNLVLPGAATALLEDTVSACLLSGKTDINKDCILTQTKKETSAPVGEPKPAEKEVLLHLEDEIHKRVVNQVEAVTAVSEAMRILRSGLSTSEKPVSFLFLGPTGVGKTETAKALSNSYFGGEKEMIRFDMSEFSSSDAVEKILGEQGITDKVFENPSSLILLDEFEKANANVLNLFLQVLDDGRLTDNKGKTVSFLNCIIIATSNAASEFIREEVAKGTVLDKEFQKKLSEFLQTKGIFKPELLNRFDGVITFKPLGQNDLFQIINLLLSELSKKMAEKDMTLIFNQSVVAKIAKEGFDEEFGARPLRRFIQDNIEDVLAKKMLNDEIKRGDKIQISVDLNNQILIIPVN